MGETPLIFAIEKSGNLDMIRLLLSLGAKADSALPKAYASNNNQIVDLLLDHGANPNYKDEEGTPAFFYGLAPTVEHLHVLAQKRDRLQRAGRERRRSPDPFRDLFRLAADVKLSPS